MAVVQPFEDGKGTLSVVGEEMVINGLVILQDAVRENNFEKGWRSEEASLRPVSEFTTLITCEVSECFEAYRTGEPLLWYEHDVNVVDGASIRPQKSGPQSGFADQVSLSPTNGTGEVVLGKPQGMASELADVVIRVLDMADELEIPVIEAILAKHKYNQTRSYRHGGKKA